MPLSERIADRFLATASGSPTVNRITPLTESAEKDFKAALASLEQTVRTLVLIRREAANSIPSGYYKMHGVPMNPADNFNATYNDADSIVDEISKITPTMKRLVQWLEEMTSETKARHGE